MIGLRLDGYDPDLHHDAAVAFCIRARDDELFSPRGTVDPRSARRDHL